MYLNLYRPHAVRSLSPLNDVAFGAALNRLFGDVATHSAVATNGTPAIRRARFDLVEKADQFLASIELPGVGKEDIAVEIEGTTVSVSTTAKAALPVGEGERVLYNERSVASYARRFELPSEVVEGSVTASFENGVLKLVLPKKEEAKAKRIAIQ